MATRTCSSKTPASCESGNRTESCRQLTKTLGRSKVEEFYVEIGPTEPRGETVDKESKGAQKPKEVKFAS